MECLPEIKRRGIAVDIDETLSWTVGHLVEEMQKRFGNPEGLSVEDLIEKYRYTWNVPYWQDDEVSEWVAKTTLSDDFFEGTSLMAGADEYLNMIDEEVPVVCYVTARSEMVSEGTKNWLRKHGFPDAPVICRPKDLDRKRSDEWKANVMSKLHPNVVGIIDDNAGILKYLDEEYKGKVFLFTHKEHDSSLAVPCEDWEAVQKNVLDYFG